jgi:RNA polymerase sigma factor (sigma-70 family)
MSPASLRRYRAERLLRDEFRSLRASVLGDVRLGLRACGAELDERDLEACYAQAWQGLYAATLQGQEIVNPPGWLRTVTRRRAIDEHRAYMRRRAVARLGADPALGGEQLATSAGEPAAESDVAEQLDARAKLGQLFEAVRLRLNERERQAFTLCYLQGLSRAEAARQMGVSEARLRKLIDGAGRGRGGASAKVAALAGTIRKGGWCAEQASLMRALAYGVLDPEGERHHVALVHTSSCPACRAYVASLRGLAAIVPPAPALLLGASGAGLSAGVIRARSAIGAARAGGGAAHSAGTSVTVGSATAASGAGAAGGSWLLAGGGVGAKLAAGCLLALGLGAGCAVLVTPAAHLRTHPHARDRARATAARSRAGSAPARPDVQALPIAAGAPGAAALPRTRTSYTTSPSARAAREFGPEQVTSSPAGEGAGAGSAATRARTASAAAQFGEVQQRTEAKQPPSQPSGSSTPPSAGNAAAAEREFSPG